MEGPQVRGSSSGKRKVPLCRSVCYLTLKNARRARVDIYSRKATQLECIYYPGGLSRTWYDACYDKPTQRVLGQTISRRTGLDTCKIVRISFLVPRSEYFFSLSYLNGYDHRVVLQLTSNN